MLASVKYTYEPHCFAWRIPFPYGSDSHVGVRLVKPTGFEEELTCGKDFVIQSGNVIYVLPPDHALILYLNAPEAEAMRAYSASLDVGAGVAPMVAAPQAASIQTEAAPMQVADDGKIALLEARLAAMEAEKETALVAQRQAEADGQIAAVREAGANSAIAVDQAASEAKAAIAEQAVQIQGQLETTGVAISDALDALDKATDDARAQAVALDQKTATALSSIELKLAELEERVEEAGRNASSQIQTIALASLNDAQAQAAAIQSDLQANVRLAGQAWPQSGWIRLANNYPAGTIIALPTGMSYYPGRNSLFAARNSFILTPGIDFEEVGTGAAASNTIRLLAATNKADLISFWIAPTNAAQEAAQYSDQSGRWAAEAQNHAQNAKLAIADCKGFAAQSEKAASKSQYWAEQGQGICLDAVVNANRFINASWIVSNMTPNGGVRAVNNEGELEYATEGSYVINPFIQMTPTPAYGVWPVADLDACNWDGFFLLGEAFDGLQPNGPPVVDPPVDPGDQNQTGASGDAANSYGWLPCKHTHEEAANA